MILFGQMDVARPRSSARQNQAKTSEAPETSNSTRMIRRNPTSLMFRNATMPSMEPAKSAGRLIARSITSLEDRLWRSSNSASQRQHLHDGDERLDQPAPVALR